MPMPFFAENPEKCARCGYLTFRCVDARDDKTHCSDGLPALWRCDRCQFERTAPLLPPPGRESRIVIC